MNEQISNILLVENEKAHIELVDRAFKSCTGKFRLRVAKSLKEALDFLTEFEFDLVIAKLFLPDGLGTELIKEERRVPLVLIICHGDEQVAEEAMKAGALDYVVKSEVTLADMPHIAGRALREWNYIIERKRMAEELRKSEQKYRHLVYEIGEVIFIADTETGIILDTNRQAELLLGRTRDEIIGMSQTELHPADKVKEYREKFKTHIEQGHAADYDGEIVRKDGRVVPVAINAAVTSLNKKQVIIGLFRDITEFKRVEGALRESEEKYRKFVETLPDMVFRLRVFRPDTAFEEQEKIMNGINEIRRADENTLDEVVTKVIDQLLPFVDGTIIDSNQMATNLLGYSLDRLGSITMADIIAPEYFDLALKNMLKIFAQESQARLEYELITADKKRVATSINARLIEREFPFIIHGVVRDTTEHKRLEAQLRQAQKMEGIGTLAGGIAHDFNNLLMGIQGNASLVLLDLDPNHEHYEKLMTIKGLVKSGTGLTRQLLGFARGGKYEAKPTDLNELVARSSRMFSRTQKELRIHQKYQENTWTVEVDQGQIEQVLLNLYVNAWQAMPGGGDLYLDTENVTLDKSYIKPFHVEPGRYVKISVSDTGVGMDEATIQRIFEPFFTTKEMGRGTGLGLASAYGIVKNHGGIINVYSEKGEGTTFNIYLPASEKEVIEERKLPEELVKGEETVLLVDDEDIIIDVGSKMLERLGYKILLARNGKEAAELYWKNKEKIDLVILDMIMPGMSGGETYNHLVRINPNVKVLLSSGYSINEQATEILERGCSGFIQKPFNLETLSQKMREILDAA